jgi:uncharacterized protein YbaA (DUF1428 family)
MAYVDGFVVAVPTVNRERYREFASAVMPHFLKQGATRFMECWGDDVPHGKVTDFYRSVQASEDETVVFAWIEWPDKATRDAGMAKVTEEMPASMKEMPFDGKRMIYGGFEAIVDDREN